MCQWVWKSHWFDNWKILNILSTASVGLSFRGREWSIWNYRCSTEWYLVCEHHGPHKRYHTCIQRVHVWMRMYIYIYLFIYLFIHLFMIYMYIFIYIYTYTHKCRYLNSMLYSFIFLDFNSSPVFFYPGLRLHSRVWGVLGVRFGWMARATIPN